MEKLHDSFHKYEKNHLIRFYIHFRLKRYFNAIKMCILIGETKYYH